MKYKTKIVGIDPQGIILEDTIAYPGDSNIVGDRGIIKINRNKQIEFFNSKKIGGTTINKPGFHEMIEGFDIIHEVAPEFCDLELIGKKVEIIIDENHRYSVAVNNSVGNIILVHLNHIRPGVINDLTVKKVTSTNVLIEMKNQQPCDKKEMAFIRRKLKRDLMTHEEIFIDDTEGYDDIKIWDYDFGEMFDYGPHAETAGNIAEKVSIKQIKSTDSVMLEVCAEVGHIYKKSYFYTLHKFFMIFAYTMLILLFILSFIFNFIMP